MEEGMKEGKKEGRQAGRQAGRKEGREEGRKRKEGSSYTKSAYAFSKIFEVRSKKLERCRNEDEER